MAAEETPAEAAERLRVLLAKQGPAEILRELYYRRRETLFPSTEDADAFEAALKELES